MTVARVYIGTWIATIAVAALSFALAPVGDLVRDLLELRLQPHRADIAYAGGIALHNVRAAGWPLLLPMLHLHHVRGARRVIVGLLTVHVVANASVVGAAIGAYPGSTRYLTHLPLEWGAVAVAVAVNGTAAGRTLTWREGACHTVMFLALILSAAAVETYLTPHT